MYIFSWWMRIRMVWWPSKSWCSGVPRTSNCCEVSILWTLYYEILTFYRQFQYQLRFEQWLWNIHCELFHRPSSLHADEKREHVNSQWFNDYHYAYEKRKVDWKNIKNISFDKRQKETNQIGLYNIMKLGMYRKTAFEINFDQNFLIIFWISVVFLGKME